MVAGRKCAFEKAPFHQPADGGRQRGETFDAVEMVTVGEDGSAVGRVERRQHEGEIDVVGQVEGRRAAGAGIGLVPAQVAIAAHEAANEFESLPAGGLVEGGTRMRRQGGDRAAMRIRQPPRLVAAHRSYRQRPCPLSPTHAKMSLLLAYG